MSYSQNVGGAVEKDGENFAALAGSLADMHPHNKGRSRILILTSVHSVTSLEC